MVDEANVETHGFDGTLHNNEVNPTNGPAWYGECQCALGLSILREVLLQHGRDVVEEVQSARYQLSYPLSAVEHAEISRNPKLVYAERRIHTAS